MNNIWRKNIYHGVINSYIKTPNSPKIRGTLLEIDENKIKVAIGNEKALDITLDKPMDAEVGEDIIIDRRNIKESKLVKQTENTAEDEQAAQDIQNKHDYILKSLNIPINDESIEAIKSLENHGVDITKENILSFMLAKEQLSDISEKLDYDTAVRIAEENEDFDKESLQKVLQEMQKIQGEKRPFSLLRFLGIKKDMTTEEAEKIAYEIYGNKAGKDITDIIKALDKAGLDTSKKNIEQINRVFSKLHDIKDIENKTIIDSVKNKIDTSIDNLYKLKNAVVKGTIKVEQKLGQLANKVYNAYSNAVGAVTEKELTQIEGDIKNRLQDMGIKITDEVVKLSKDVIATGLDLTEENLQKIMSIKGAIVELNFDLDYEKTAFLIASGVNVEKVEVVELKDMIHTEYNIENIENIEHNTEHISLEHDIHIPAEHNTERISSEQGTENTPAEHDIEHISIEYGTGSIPAENSTEHIPIEQGNEHISMKYDTEHISAEHDVEHISMERMEHIPIEHDTDHIPAKNGMEHISVGHDTGRIPAERSITLGLDRLEILELAENIDIKTLAFHMKLDLPTTLESLNLSQQLIDGEITIDEWLNTLNEQLNPNEQLNSDVQSTETAQKGPADIQIEKTELNMPKIDQPIEQSLDTATGEAEQLDTPEMEQTQTSEIPRELETNPIETSQTEIAREPEQSTEQSSDATADEIEQFQTTDTSQGLETKPAQTPQIRTGQGPEPAQETKSVQESEIMQETEIMQVSAEEAGQIQSEKTTDVPNDLQFDKTGQRAEPGEGNVKTVDVGVAENPPANGAGIKIENENYVGAANNLRTNEETEIKNKSNMKSDFPTGDMKDETITETQRIEPASVEELSIDKVELRDVLDKLANMETTEGSDFIAENYLKANGDKPDILMEEKHTVDILEATIQNNIPIDSNNMQEIYALKKALDNIVENLTTDTLQNAIKEGISLEKIDLRELTNTISLLKEEAEQNIETKSIQDGIKNEEAKTENIQNDIQEKEIKVKNVEAQEQNREKVENVHDEAESLDWEIKKTDVQHEFEIKNMGTREKGGSEFRSTEPAGPAVERVKIENIEHSEEIANIGKNIEHINIENTGINSEHTQINEERKMFLDLNSQEILDINRQGLLDIIENMDIRTLALHIKLGLPATLESLNFSQQLIDGNITTDEWLNTLEEQLNQNEQLNSDTQSIEMEQIGLTDIQTEEAEQTRSEGVIDAPNDLQFDKTGQRAELGAGNVKTVDVGVAENPPANGAGIKIENENYVDAANNLRTNEEIEIKNKSNMKSDFPTGDIKDETMIEAQGIESISTGRLSINETELSETLERLRNAGNRTLNMITQGYLRINNDELGVLAGESYKFDMAKAIIQSGIPLNNDNIQEMYELKKTLDSTVENLATDMIRNALEGDISIEKIDIKQLTEVIDLLDKEEIIQNTEYANIKYDTEIVDAHVSSAPGEKMAPGLGRQETLDLGKQEILDLNSQEMSDLNKQELLDLIESIDIKTLALHMKLDLPTTLESLNLSQQLMDEDITIDEWLNTLNEQLDQNVQLNSDVQSTEMEQKELADTQIEKTELTMPKTKQSTEQSLNIATEEAEQLDTPEMEQTQTSEILQELETNPIETSQTEIAREPEQSTEQSSDATADEIEQFQTTDTLRGLETKPAKTPQIRTGQEPEPAQETKSVQESEIMQETEIMQVSAEEAGQIQSEKTVDVPNDLQFDKTGQRAEFGADSGKTVDVGVAENLPANGAGIKIENENYVGAANNSRTNEETEIKDRSNMKSDFPTGDTKDETITETQENEPISTEKLSIDKVELLDILDKLINMETTEGLDFIAQSYLEANGDKPGTLTEEDYIADMVKTMIQSDISLNSDNIQELYALKKALNNTFENLTTDTLQNAIKEGISLEKIDLKEPTDTISLLKEKVEQRIEISPEYTQISEEEKIAPEQNRQEISDMGRQETLDLNSQEILDTNKQGLLDLIERIDIKTLALHIKLDLPTTLESLNLSQQLIDGDITADEWLNVMTEPAPAEGLPADKAELSDVLDGLTNTETARELDFIAQNYLQANSDKLGALMEENYGPEIARAIMQSGISLNNNNIQDIYMLKKALERTIENLTADAFQNVVGEGISLEKTDLRELVDIINTLNEEKINQNIEVKSMLNNTENISEEEKGLGVTKNIVQNMGNGTGSVRVRNVPQEARNQNILEDKFDITENKETGNTIKNSESVTENENIIPEENIRQGRASKNVLKDAEEITDENVSAGTEKLTDKNASANTAQAEEIVDKMKGMVDILKQISPERKNTIISLLMKNAMPLTLKEVQNLSFFLSNQRQIGHQLDEILNLIDKNENPEVIRIAGELKKVISKINGNIKEGRQIEGRPYEDFSKLLKELESKSSFLTKEDKETLQKVGEKLLDSLELQLQLNREDTVLQLPLMMSEYLKNLQIYVMRDKKGSKKINPKDMSILLNFDTNNMGNVNIYIAVNYKNIVMKMGLANEEDQNLIEKYSAELEEHLEELGYDLKDLSFRISDDNHILSMAGGAGEKEPVIKRLLDIRI